MKKWFYFGFLITLALLLGCQAVTSTETESATPSIASIESTTPPAPTSPPLSEPESPTAVSTISKTVEPTESATDTPPSATFTPQPTVQLVDSLQLVSVLPAGQLFKPVYLTHAFDERLFILEQIGTIHIFDDGMLLPDPFLDIQERVNSNANEQGLLGLAFHPDYLENGRFFVNYTNIVGSTVIAQFNRLEANPNLADPNSEQILLTIEQPYPNHNGGQIKFGPDGYLYIGMGDGGSAGDPDNNGQNFATLLGNLLRIDVDAQENGTLYGIPPTNPFINDGAVQDEIWATGLRNPWRFSFDRLTGDLFITDVGQNAWEEVNFQPAASLGGENYGWNYFESVHCFSNPCPSDGLTEPVVDYSHEFGCSITGGYIYRGEQFPELWGNYFFTDFCTGIIWAMVQQADGTWQSQIVFDSERLVASFGEDQNGELYLLDHQSGEILQIQSLVQTN